MEKIFEGEVVSWNEIKRFGFISYEHHGRKRIYFCTRTIRPDWKGSRAWAFGAGIPVTFKIHKRKDTQSAEVKDIAINVTPIFQMSEPENLRSYREVSVVRKKEFDVVFLTRPCGDTLFLHRNDVVEQYRSRWDLLVEGAPIYHGMRYSEEKQQWQACDAELYSSAELDEFFHPRPVEPEPILEAEPQPEPDLATVLAPYTRSLPLIEIIKRRKS